MNPVLIPVGITMLALLASLYWIKNVRQAIIAIALYWILYGIYFK